MPQITCPRCGKKRKATTDGHGVTQAVCDACTKAIANADRPEPTKAQQAARKKPRKAVE